MSRDLAQMTNDWTGSKHTCFLDQSKVLKPLYNFVDVGAWPGFKLDSSARLDIEFKVSYESKEALGLTW